MIFCAIITLHTPHNFGAMLQAYALQSAVSEMGHKVEIIDHCEKEGPPKLFSKKGIKKFPNAMLCLLHRKHRERKYNRFNSFSDQYLKLSKSCKKPVELAQATINYDVLICGSDQIWNPTNSNFDPKFFLDFGPQRSIRIAYAPSFGVREIPPLLHPYLTELLSKLDSLSCREQSGKQLMEALTNRQISHVVDPTMLITANHWKTMSKTPNDLPPKYILAYALDNSIEFINAVEELSKKLSLPVVCIEVNVRSPMFHCEHIIRDAGPLEFLGLVANAEFVITNSFHGCVFSILFNKQFFSPRHCHSNERMGNLFEWTQISHVQNLKIALSNPKGYVDYSKLNPILSNAISHSTSYLDGAIKSKI